MKVLGIIPARYASTRFPGKMLADIAGKSMVQRVYEQVKKSNISDLIIATDDARIAEHVTSFGADCVMTKPGHPSGTDRCHEAVQKLKSDHSYIVNIQGDEPFIDPAQINELMAVLDGKTEIATLIRKIDRAALMISADEAKVILNKAGEAIYFSRSPVPHVRGKKVEEWHLATPCYHHIGLYAYRADVLEKVAKLPPAILEQAESLEQLRWLENGLRIRAVVTEKEDGFCVERPEDLQKAIELAKKKEP